MMKIGVSFRQVGGDSTSNVDGLDCNWISSEAWDLFRRVITYLVYAVGMQ